MIYGCCLLLTYIAGICATVDDLIFQYRCAEYSYHAGDYSSARRFYSDIISHCHNPSHLGLLSATGIIDTMLITGDWFSANEFVENYNLAIFQHLFGYDSLLLRECFLLIKNEYFQSAKNLLLSIDFLKLSDDDICWYHCLYALLLSHQKNVHDAESEFNIALGLCSKNSQRAVIEAIKMQSKIENIGINSNIDLMIQSLKDNINHYGYGSRSLPFLKQYILLLSFLQRQDEISDELVDVFIEQVSTTEERYDILLYQAIYWGICSKNGLHNLKNVLLLSSNKRTQLLALKLITHASCAHDELENVLSMLDEVYQDSFSDWLKQQILLAEMAITITHGVPQVCQKLANQYINTFEHDQYFEEIYELLAYLAIDEDVSEYRLSAHYLDKLRVSMSDINTQLAVSLKIADAFFYNHDFKLASEIYAEVLSLDSSEKFQEVIENQVISDIAQRDFEKAKQHLEGVSGFPQKKCEAIFHYLKALKTDKKYSDGLNYVDSIDKKQLSKIFKFKLYLYKAQILAINEQYHQAILLTTKIYNAFIPSDISSNKEVWDLVSHALFIEGCCLLKLHDTINSGRVFEHLRMYFRYSKYASASYIKEAEYWQNCGDFRKAFELLDKCRDEKYFLYARYKMAEILRQEGKMSEALKMLEWIIQKEESTNLAIVARIIQGDILRVLGKFSDAKEIYDIVLNKTHDDDYVRYISLARVRCLLAQGSRKPAAIDNAIVELDKLYLVRDIDLAWYMEVAAEYCFALKLKNNFGKLQYIALDALKMLPVEESQLSSNTIFWALQILYLLQDNFHEIGVQQYDIECVRNMVQKFQSLLKND